MPISETKRTGSDYWIPAFAEIANKNADRMSFADGKQTKSGPLRPLFRTVSGLC